MSKIDDFTKRLYGQSEQTISVSDCIRIAREIFCETEKPQKHDGLIMHVPDQPQEAPCHVCGLRKGHSLICSVSPEPLPFDKEHIETLCKVIGQDKPQDEYCQCKGIPISCCACGKPDRPKPDKVNEACADLLKKGLGNAGAGLPDKGGGEKIAKLIITTVFVPDGTAQELRAIQNKINEIVNRLNGVE